MEGLQGLQLYLPRPRDRFCNGVRFFSSGKFSERVQEVVAQKKLFSKELRYSHRPSSALGSLQMFLRSSHAAGFACLLWIYPLLTCFQPPLQDLSAELARELK